MAVDIKNLSDYSDKIRNVSHILSETLGTTTSYSFFEDTLRPYVKKNLKEYILNHWNDEELVEIVNALKKQAEVELKEGWVGGVEIPDGQDSDATKDAIITYALSQMDGTNLSSLNRLVVKDGYCKGHLKGHVFPDVIPAFKKWSEEGKKIYLYSSGMELSQKCLISNTIDGDMSELISGCFESSEYPPAKSESFRELCKKVDSPADKVAFLTHNATTACAAHKAGLVVIMLSRDGNSYLGNCTRESFPVITSFDDISKQICGKRKAPVEENADGKRAKLDEQLVEKEAEKQVEDKVESVSDSNAQAEKSEVEVPVEMDSEVKDDPEEKMEVDEETKEIVKPGDCEVKVVVTPPVDDASVEKDSEKVGGAEEAVEKVSEEVGSVPEKAEKISDKVNGAPEELEKVGDKEVPEKVKETAAVQGVAEETVDKVKDVPKDSSEKVKEIEKQEVDEVKEKETVETVKDSKEEASGKVDDGEKETAMKGDESKEGCNETKEEEPKADVKDEVKREVDAKESSEKADVAEDVFDKVEGKVCVNEKVEEKELKEESKKEVAVENVTGDSSLEAKAEVTEAAAKNDDAASSEEDKAKENGVSEAKVVENGGDAVSVKEKSEVNGNGIMHVNGKGDGVDGDKAKSAEKNTEIVAKKVETDNKVEATAEETA
ncbi:enolase-phosphatase E1-like [Ischnura elegans]|uniref:enolase-phosphatase E1-like n=1 Tax=Ischnura elegans TaxID=197161 RepID=UPI001ED8BD94|nr:enolase-phosphatase E1-like [Ischnura elegans]